MPVHLNCYHVNNFEGDEAVPFSFRLELPKSWEILPIQLDKGNVPSKLRQGASELAKYQIQTLEKRRKYTSIPCTSAQPNMIILLGPRTQRPSFHAFIIQRSLFHILKRNTWNLVWNGRNPNARYKSRRGYQRLILYILLSILFQEYKMGRGTIWSQFRLGGVALYMQLEQK